MAMGDDSDESTDDLSESDGEEQPQPEAERQEVAEDDLHGGEQAPIRMPRNPEDPLPEEREKHCRSGHLPYRAWCVVCVKARGREDQRKAKREKDEDGGGDHGLLQRW